MEPCTCEWQLRQLCPSNCCAAPIGDGTVRVVAVTAGNQTFGHRMVRAQLQLSAFFRMTAFANGRLRQFAQYRVLCSVDVVTRHAAEIGGLVFAGLPVGRWPFW